MGQYNIKNIREEFKSKGIFYTPPELAEYMKSLVDVDIKDVYDPTCGDGSLLSCFPDDMPKFGQEINDHQLAVAEQRLKNFTGVCADTLKEPAFMDKRFSCIVGNPPFSIAWELPQTGLFGDVRFNDGIQPFWSFCTLWSSINSAQNWEDNPFVWVYEFERIEKPDDFI